MSRFQQILVELDAAGAQDCAYRSAFSTGGKVRLRRGETWRGRLLALIAYQESKKVAQ